MKLGTTLMSLWMNFRQVMGATGPPPSTLLNDLVSYWPLNEISGTRADVVGGNDLTDNNTVGSVLRGPEGTVAKTVYASSEYLSRTQTIDYSLGVTASIWFYQATGANVQGRFFQHGGAHYYGGTGTFSLTDGNSTPNLYAGVGDNASIVNATTQSSGLNAWHHVVMWYDPSDKKVRMRLDGQAAVASASGLANHPDPAAGLYNDVVIGRETVVGVYTDALFGPTALWNRLLTTDEQTALFAAGNAARYADVDVGASCIGWWELDEVSGTRVDSHGSNDLTDNNTVGSVNSGPKGVVASFVAANGEFLSATATLPASSTDFTAAVWFKNTDSTGYQMLMTNGIDFEIRRDNGVYALVGITGGNATSAVAYTGNEWHLALFWLDGTTEYISVDNGTPQTNSVTPANPGTTFRIGARTDGFYFAGQIGEAAIWSRALTSDERTSLFASGQGKRYADLTDAEKVGLVSYWNLDEASGVRYDSHGTNHLTDNNTVGSVINAGDAMDGAAASFVAANTESLSHATATFPTSEADFSVSMWIKPTAASGAHTIINSGTGSGANEWLLSHGADFTLTVDGDSDTAGTCTTDWQHVVLTYVTATKVMTLYVDTVSVVSGTGTGTGAYKAANDLFLGVQGDGTTEPYGGQIDEVAFWSRALSTAEIADLYAAGAGFFYNTTTEDFE